MTNSDDPVRQVVNPASQTPRRAQSWTVNCLAQAKATSAGPTGTQIEALRLCRVCLYRAQ